MAHLVHYCRKHIKRPGWRSVSYSFSLCPHQHHTLVHNDRSQCPSLVLSSRSLWHLPQLITMSLKIGSCLTSLVSELSRLCWESRALQDPPCLTRCSASPPQTPHLRIFLSSSSNPLSSGTHCALSHLCSFASGISSVQHLTLQGGGEQRASRPQERGNGNSDYLESDYLPVTLWSYHMALPGAPLP